MTKISDEVLSDYRDCFSLFDKTGENKIAFYEVGECLRAIGLNPTNSEVQKVLNHPSKDEMNNKLVSFEEFIPMLSQVQRQAVKNSTSSMADGLKVFDNEGNGTVSAYELRHVLTTLGEKLSEEEVEQLFVGQEDQNGCINYENFVSLVMDG